MRATWVLAAVLGAAAGATRAGDLVGTVRYVGTARRTPPIEATKDRAVCGDSVDDESLVVVDGRLANAIIAVKGAPPAAPTQAVLDQERCRFRPHVQAVPVGSTLEVRNGDALLHSVHGWAGHATRFDLVVPSKGARIPTKLTRPGLIQVRCDVHGWMQAWVLVADVPAVTTGRDGAFAVRGLPPGTYTVSAWHERLGEKTLEVTVPARGEVRLEVTYD